MQRNIAVTRESEVALPYIVIRLKCSQLACCRLEYEAWQQGAITAHVEPGDSQPAKYPLQGPHSPKSLTMGCLCWIGLVEGPI